ncbi:predicted protein [Histoplasma capsulatum var. duboisii H88]|uniref:Predicted protein n=1 Tax=Ajellomyces capsulatus (strain H88) TaxID=544711 RepID=F0US34_AJEC8|nr:predicted protein [Histoplasma capsulatum var. duboisii H88]
MACSSYSWSKRASPHPPLCLVSSSDSLELADKPAGIPPSARKLDPRYDKSTAVIDSVGGISLLQPAWSLGQASNGLKIWGSTCEAVSVFEREHVVGGSAKG